MGIHPPLTYSGDSKADNSTTNYRASTGTSLWASTPTLEVSRRMVSYRASTGTDSQVSTHTAHSVKRTGDPNARKHQHSCDTQVPDEVWRLMTANARFFLRRLTGSPETLVYMLGLQDQRKSPHHSLDAKELD